LESKNLALKISEFIFEKKGYDVKILDLTKVASFADYFVVCSADSDTQVKAISDEVERRLREVGVFSWHREGYESLSWVLLDYVDVIAHIFKKDARQYYNLEKLWGDANVIEVQDPAAVKSQNGSKQLKKPAKKTTRKKTAGKNTVAGKTKSSKSRKK
jgi:ribosome-associated protein